MMGFQGQTHKHAKGPNYARENKYSEPKHAYRFLKTVDHHSKKKTVDHHSKKKKLLTISS
jgi:hypothetical protein